MKKFFTAILALGLILFATPAHADTGVVKSDPNELAFYFGTSFTLLVIGFVLIFVGQKIDNEDEES